METRCSACDAVYEEKGELYFNRTSILARSNEVPQVVFTCHKCLQFFYGVIVPDLIKTYKGDNVVCQMQSKAKSLTGTKQEPIFSRLKRYFKSRG